MQFQASPRFFAATKLDVPLVAGGLIIDVWLFILPLVAIYKLKLHSTRRIGLTIIFSTDPMLVFPIWDRRSLMYSCRAVAASTVSLYFRHRLQHSHDMTWTVLDVDLL